MVDLKIQKLQRVKLVNTDLVNPLSQEPSHSPTEYSSIRVVITHFMDKRSFPPDTTHAPQLTTKSSHTQQFTPTNLHPCTQKNTV